MIIWVIKFFLIKHLFKINLVKLKHLYKKNAQKILFEKFVKGF